MAQEISDTDVGKTVVTAEDERIGRVSEVENGRAHVDVEEGLTDTISSTLDWATPDDGTFELESDRIEEITDNEIQLHES